MGVNKLNFGFHKARGRGREGITSRHRGGGKRILFRNVDFVRFMPGVEGKLLKIVSDGYRSGKVGLIGYTNGVVSYMLLPSNYKTVNSFISYFSSEDGEFKSTNYGVSCPLYCVKPGTAIYNVELQTFQGGKLARSAGACATLLKKFSETGLVKLPSGKLLLLPLRNMCSIGEVSNELHKRLPLGKAGRKRWLGFRPHVRGVAMNPVDHPHGGRTNGGKVPCTAWGRIAKGPKTARKRS
jgi:large subunit ribosomal protein L2